MDSNIVDAPSAALDSSPTSSSSSSDAEAGSASASDEAISSAVAESSEVCRQISSNDLVAEQALFGSNTAGNVSLEHAATPDTADQAEAGDVLYDPDMKQPAAVDPSEPAQHDRLQQVLPEKAAQQLPQQLQTEQAVQQLPQQPSQQHEQAAASAEVLRAEDSASSEGALQAHDQSTCPAELLPLTSADADVCAEYAPTMSTAQLPELNASCSTASIAQPVKQSSVGRLTTVEAGSVSSNAAVQHLWLPDGSGLPVVDPQEAKLTAQHSMDVQVGSSAHRASSAAELQEVPVQHLDSDSHMQHSIAYQADSPEDTKLQHGLDGGSLEVNLGSSSLQVSSLEDTADMQPESWSDNNTAVAVVPTNGSTAGLWRDVNSPVASSVGGESSSQGLNPDDFSDPVASRSGSMHSSQSSSSVNEAQQLVLTLEGQASAQSEILVVEHAQPSLCSLSAELLSAPPDELPVVEVTSLLALSFFRCHYLIVLSAS